MSAATPANGRVVVRKIAETPTIATTGTTQIRECMVQFECDFWKIFNDNTLFE